MKPILFNTKMVQAIIDCRKTVTRRVVKPQPAPTSQIQLASGRYAWSFWGDGDRHLMKSPYDRGDILYVRETFCVGKIEFGEEPDGREVPYVSQCIGECDCIPKEYTIRYEIGTDDVVWRPSIHMPKEAARIFLRVADVRVERLQDIDDEGAKAEGVNFKNWKGAGFEEKMRHFAIERFAEIWDSTIKKKDRDRYGWDANPWVWVIEFQRISREDAVDADCL